MNSPAALNGQRGNSPLYQMHCPLKGKQDISLQFFRTHAACHDSSAESSMIIQHFFLNKENALSKKLHVQLSNVQFPDLCLANWKGKLCSVDL